MLARHSLGPTPANRGHRGLVHCALAAGFLTSDHRSRAARCKRGSSAMAPLRVGCQGANGQGPRLPRTCALLPHLRCTTAPQGRPASLLCERTCMAADCWERKHVKSLKSLARLATPRTALRSPRTNRPPSERSSCPAAARTSWLSGERCEPQLAVSAERWTPLGWRARRGCGGRVR